MWMTPNTEPPEDEMDAEREVENNTALCPEMPELSLFSELII